MGIILLAILTLVIIIAGLVTLGWNNGYESKEENEYWENQKRTVINRFKNNKSEEDDNY